MIAAVSALGGGAIFSDVEKGGFVALLTGAIAQRFVAADIHAEVVDAETQVAGEIANARESLRRELRAISTRLRELERLAMSRRLSVATS